ncbi:hypothetical protein ONA70_07915 [Micromonospora yasonensis]|uniref:hypothetical protein n=1 Tax=Micromonospora yasonensis TaxID=1128667 RepID=UPI00222F4AF6|nr:hypothetical protein [Micromonospora yasonensis]MCW3840023.1 hypothetical protein [Micromonospora yasonensis]
MLGGALNGALLTGGELAGGARNGAPLTGDELTGGPLTGGALTGAGPAGGPLTGVSLTGAAPSGSAVTGAALAGGPLICATCGSAEVADPSARSISSFSSGPSCWTWIVGLSQPGACEAPSADTDRRASASSA